MNKEQLKKEISDWIDNNVGIKTIIQVNISSTFKQGSGLSNNNLKFERVLE